MALRWFGFVARGANGHGLNVILCRAASTLSAYGSSTPKDLADAGLSAPKDTAYSVLRKIPVSPRKINAIAKQIRGLSVREAELQLTFHRQQNAKYVKKGVILAKANAENNYGLDGNRLLITEAYVGRATHFKEIRYHARGKHGTMEHPQCHLWIRVKEIPLTEGERRLGRFGWTHATWKKVDPTRAPAKRITAPQPRRQTR